MNVSRNKTILVLCPFPIGVAASQRLKYEQYLDDWRSLGYVIQISAFLDISAWNILYSRGNYIRKGFGVLRGQFRRYRDLLRVSSYSIVYVHMWVTPFGSTLFERLVRKLAKYLIYDIEDNLLSNSIKTDSRLNPNSWIQFLKGPRKAQILVKTADHVITSSPFLNIRCQGLNTRGTCTYISSSVNTDRFKPANPYSNEHTVVIGWTGTFSSKIYLDSLREVFLDLTKRVEFKLKVIGNFDYDLPGLDLEVIQWSSQTEVEDLQTIDIGVYPLPIDDWVLGKSGLKAIQYMAFGLPIVASNVGTTSLLISHGVDGLLVKSPEEWVSSLEMLVREPEIRRKFGEAARRKAVERYSISTIKHDYRRVLGVVRGVS